MVFLRDHAPALRVFAGAGNGQLAFALQELQGVAGAFGPLLLHNGEHLVLQVAVAEIVKALAGHGAVFDALLLRHKVQNGVHERRLSGGAGALDDERQRVVKLAGDGGEIAHQDVGLLTDQAAALKVGLDAVQQLGVFEQGQRRLAFAVFQHDFLALRLDGFADVLFLQLFDFQKHLAQVALERVSGLAGLAVGLRQKVLPVLGVAQVERVQVIVLAGQHAQLHAQGLERKIFADAPHAPLALAKGEGGLVAVGNGRFFFSCWRWWWWWQGSD